MIKGLVGGQVGSGRFEFLSGMVMASVPLALMVPAAFTSQSASGTLSVSLYRCVYEGTKVGIEPPKLSLVGLVTGLCWRLGNGWDER